MWLLMLLKMQPPPCNRGAVALLPLPVYPECHAVVSAGCIRPGRHECALSCSLHILIHGGIFRFKAFNGGQQETLESGDLFEQLE